MSAAERIQELVGKLLTKTEMQRGLVLRRWGQKTLEERLTYLESKVFDILRSRNLNNERDDKARVLNQHTFYTPETRLAHIEQAIFRILAHLNMQNPDSSKEDFLSFTTLLEPLDHRMLVSEGYLYSILERLNMISDAENGN